jgi:hypothetical protein
VAKVGILGADAGAEDVEIKDVFGPVKTLFFTLAYTTLSF